MSAAPPIIPEHLWLTAADLNEIRAVVGEMVVQIGRQAPLLPTSKMHYLGPARLVPDGSPGPVCLEELRAYCSFIPGGTPTVTLDPFPLWFEHAVDFASDIGGFERMIGGLLAHELSHVYQVTRGETSSAQDYREATAAAALAKSNKQYESYIDYVAKPVELAAHATQLAVEVLEEHGPGLDEPRFLEAARGAWVWRHVELGHEWQHASRKDSEAQFARISASFEANGWWAYERLS